MQSIYDATLFSMLTPVNLPQKFTDTPEDKITITQNTYICQYNKDDIKNAVKDVLGLFPQIEEV